MQIVVNSFMEVPQRTHFMMYHTDTFIVFDKEQTLRI